MRLPREYVVFKNGNAQHAGGGWEGSRCLRNHLYLVWADVDLKDGAMFVYGDSMQRELQNKREFLLGDLNPLCMSDEKDAADDNEPRKIVSVWMTAEENNHSVIDVWPDYSTDTPIEENEDRKVCNLSFEFLCILWFDKVGFWDSSYAFLHEDCVEGVFLRETETLLPFSKMHYISLEHCHEERYE